MYRSLILRASSGALAIAFLAAPGGASTMLTPMANRPVAALAGGAPGRHAQFAQKTVALTGPIGCTTDGRQAFFGKGVDNHAGGEANGNGGYASVVNGFGNASCDAYTTIAGGKSNTIGGDGSSAYSLIGGGYHNAVAASWAFIGQGQDNTIGTSGSLTSGYSAIVSGQGNAIASQFSFIGAGQQNTILSDDFSVIGGGDDNAVTGDYSIVGGGKSNAVSGELSTIAGGIGNIVTNLYSFAGGGYQNYVQGAYSVVAGGNANNAVGSMAFVGGGYNNQATALNTTVAGGYQNNATANGAVTAGGLKNTASGMNSAVPGGELNVAAGKDSFAAGTASDAVTQGAFVWSDDAAGATKLTSTASNQFLARASGGFVLYSAANLSSGVALAPGSGAWSTLSDRNVKNHIEAIDPAQILARLDTMPVSEWSYDAEGAVRHLGPMAQDFRAAFGLGEDDRHISTVDEEGVALAAIKALHDENSALKSDNAGLREAHRLDQSRLTRLEERLDAVESRLAGDVAKRR